MKHRCKRCGRSFARSEHLSRHDRSHTKEKPFSCHGCPQAFTRKDLLTRHTRIHHASTRPSTGQAGDFGYPVQTQSWNVGGASNTVLSGSHPRVMGTQSMSAGPNPLSTSLDGEHTNLNHAAPQASGDPSNTQDESIIPWSPAFPFDFSTYMDTVDYPTGPFSSVYQPLPFNDLPELVVNPDVASRFSDVGAWQDVGTHIRNANATSGPCPTSRAPSVQPPMHSRYVTEHTGKDPALEAHLKVDERCREAILLKLQSFGHVLPYDYKLPTKHTLTRFVYAWVTTFSNHYPMIHLPSLSLSSMSTELFLAIASLGAQYCYERDKGRPLFEMSKIIALERLRQYPKSHEDIVSCSAMSNVERKTQTLQTFILLIAISMWSQSDPSIRDALSLRNPLLSLLQDGTVDALPAEFASTDCGSAWVQYETTKRTKLIAFCMLNLLTIAFDVPPVLLYRDLRLVLPCGESMWVADLQRDSGDLPSVRDEVCFNSVLDTLEAKGPLLASQLDQFTSLSNYVLIHMIIQRIWVAHQTESVTMTGGVEYVASIEKTLRTWQECCWQQDQTLSKDSTNSASPLSFTSLALLRLAYIRVTTNSSFTGYLNIWDANKIGLALCQAPQVPRSDRTARFALHCAQALAIPIKTGLNFVAHTQVFYWSNQYALCSFECALLLSKWLEVVTTKEISSPRTLQEDNVLDFVIQLMAETEYDISRDELLSGRALSILVLRLWARLFRRDHVWELVSIIGMSLESYADNLGEHERS